MESRLGSTVPSVPESISAPIRARDAVDPLASIDATEFTSRQLSAILGNMPCTRKNAPAQRRPPGRPSIYSDELATKICGLVAEGYSLRQIGDLPQMPHKRTVKRWLSEKPSFQMEYARAKKEMAEHFAEEMLEIADDGSNDWIERELERGNVIKVADHEHIAAISTSGRYPKMANVETAAEEVRREAGRQQPRRSRGSTITDVTR